MSEPRAFQELATKAHDIEVTISKCHNNSFGFAESKKDKGEFRRNFSFSKYSTKKTMSISNVELVQIMGNLKENIKGAPLSKI